MHRLLHPQNRDGLSPCKNCGDIMDLPFTLTCRPCVDIEGSLFNGLKRCKTFFSFAIAASLFQVYTRCLLGSAMSRSDRINMNIKLTG